MDRDYINYAIIATDNNKSVIESMYAAIVSCCRDLSSKNIELTLHNVFTPLGVAHENYNRTVYRRDVYIEKVDELQHCDEEGTTWFTLCCITSGGYDRNEIYANIFGLQQRFPNIFRIEILGEYESERCYLNTDTSHRYFKDRYEIALDEFVVEDNDSGERSLSVYDRTTVYHKFNNKEKLNAFFLDVVHKLSDVILKNASEGLKSVVCSKDGNSLSVVDTFEYDLDNLTKQSDAKYGSSIDTVCEAVFEELMDIADNIFLTLADKDKTAADVFRISIPYVGLNFFVYHSKDDYDWSE